MKEKINLSSGFLCLKVDNDQFCLNYKIQIITGYNWVMGKISDLLCYQVSCGF